MVQMTILQNLCMEEDLKLIEGEIVHIYENEKGEKLINARELFYALRGKETKTKFADWIKERLIKYKFIENIDYICFRKITKAEKYGNKTMKEYYLTIDTSKELCMIENNEIGRKIRMYFIETEKRYRSIIETPQNIFDVMRLALNQIEENEKRLTLVENLSEEANKISKENEEEIKNIKKKIDVIIQKDYCLASDIAEQLQIYSENNLPHSNFIGAIARTLGMKISYKHYFEDDEIAIVPDISKGNQYYQIYYKPTAVNRITKWFEQNREETEYKIIYERNTKNGKRGEIKERGYKVENVCYKIRNS